MIQNETRADIALGALSISQDKPVYNSTTIPITHGSQQDNVIINNKRVDITPKEKFVKSKGDQRILTSLEAKDPVDIEFRDLSYTVKVGFRKAEKEILHDINGKFPGSQLIAIMGPSGAGKSTLLDCLSGFRTTGVEGQVMINGRRRDLTTFRRMSCYITQDDRLQPLLTVLENMRIAADLKLGKNSSEEDKEVRIEDILIGLGLYEHSDTLTGNLSGGQKKRLSIALEMISNPTVMFLDEPTTGLDSYSCNKVIELLKELASQGRTVICTIHQPSAKLFQEFNQVYVLAGGECLYQGGTGNLVPFLQAVDLPCPMYHNPADYIIELACEEHGRDKVDILVKAMGNGTAITWFEDPSKVLKGETLLRAYPTPGRSRNRSLEDTSFCTQLWILLKRGVIKTRRDKTLTHLRIGVNIFLAIVLGFLYVNAGNEGSRVLDNYNLLFAILMHHSMTTMMLTVLTFPTEMSILLKEHFNRWYSLKAYYMHVSILDFPISVLCCLIFSVMIYFLSSQPMEWMRFEMFFAISLLVVFVGQSIGLMIGGICNVVNGTFLAPILTIPMMMFAGFGVTLRDLPNYLKWGSHISYLRYGLEGYVGAIYGEQRATLDCEMAPYCHYRYPQKFLSEITMRGDQFWKDVWALSVTVLILRTVTYYLLKWKINSVK